MTARRLIRVLPLVLLLAISTQLAGEEARIMRAFQKGGSSVVPIHFTLRLMQAPEGGQGGKVEGVICGVVVSDDGLVVTTADVFPDPGGDPRQTFVPSSFIIKSGGRMKKGSVNEP